MPAGDGKVKKILCYKLDEWVGNTERILLMSLRTIRDANVDILYHMDKSLDGISAPLLFLQDKSPSSSKKKRTTGWERSRCAEVPDASEEEAGSRECVRTPIGVQLADSKGIC